jgi:hypothetical protein
MSGPAESGCIFDFVLQNSGARTQQRCHSIKNLHGHRRAIMAP